MSKAFVFAKRLERKHPCLPARSSKTRNGAKKPQIKSTRFYLRLFPFLQSLERASTDACAPVFFNYISRSRQLPIA